MMETEAVRVRLGAGGATDPAVLARLARDPSVTVRASLALNPAAPAEADAVLMRDPDERVRALLARKLGSLVPTLSDAEREVLRQQTWTMLTQLAEDQAERVRTAIAAEVKDLPDAPRTLILHLARDPVVTVCEPVILFSPMLTSADLVGLVASAPSPGTRRAVASRSNLPEPVSDAIAESTDDDAIQALLTNQSAQIREATLDALVARAEMHAGWHDPLVRRPLLSAQAARALSEIVTSHLLEVLAARADVTEAFRQRLRVRLATAPERDPAHDGGAPQCGANARGANAGGANAGGARAGHAHSSDPHPGDPHPGDPHPGAFNPGGSGQPDRGGGPVDGNPWDAARKDHGGGSPPMEAQDQIADQLLEAARKGDVRFAITLLATRAGVEVGLVQQAATLRSTKGLVALTWKAGLPMRVAVAMQTLLANVAPGSVIVPGPGDSFPLAVEEMKWQLDFLATAAASEPAAKAWFSGGSGSRAPTR